MLCHFDWFDKSKNSLRQISSLTLDRNDNRLEPWIGFQRTERAAPVGFGGSGRPPTRPRPEVGPRGRK